MNGNGDLTQRVEDAIKGAVVSKLKVNTAERVSLSSPVDDGFHPVLALSIQNQTSGTTTIVEIPLGLANPDHRNYFASINEDGRYQRYESPEDIGYEAAGVFRRDYTSAVMGI